jgi:DNA-binding NarL/FixJ family response regulator
MDDRTPSVGSTKAGSILIVDPDEQARARLSEALGQLGLPVIELDNFEDALRAAEQAQPSAAIIEVMLPTRSGYELCRVLKQRFGADLAVIFVSGQRSDAVDRVAGLLIGADDYLVKPVHPDELLLRTQRLIRQRDPADRRHVGLTAREQEVLELLCDGLHEAAIAELLVITPRTVGKHLEHIFTKLGVHTRAQAVAAALRDDVAPGVDAACHVAH